MAADLEQSARLLQSYQEAMADSVHARRELIEQLKGEIPKQEQEVTCKVFSYSLSDPLLPSNSVPL